MSSSDQKELLVRTLSKHLYADEQLSAYVLVDPILREPFEKEWLDDLSCEVFTIHTQSPSLEERQQPRLIRLNPKVAELLDESVSRTLEEQSDPQSELTRGFAMGGWLLTTVSGSSLAKHLALCMRRTLYLKDKWSFFRWQDRRVMEWMWPQLTLRQQCALLGPITQWWALDRRDQLCVYSAVPSDDASIRTRPGIILNAQQGRHAQCCELSQAVIRGWRMFCPRLPTDSHQTADKIISMALEQGVQSQQDIVLLAAYILQVHTELLTHPKVKAMIYQANQQPGSLDRLIRSVSDSEWSLIQYELDGGHSNSGTELFGGDTSDGCSGE